MGKLEFAVGPEPADILVRRCRVIALLELADRDERDVEHRVVLRHFDFPGSTAQLQRKPSAVRAAFDFADHYSTFEPV